MDGWTNRPTGQHKSGLWSFINALETFKNIQNVFILSKTPFKKFCDGPTDGPTDQPTENWRFDSALQ